MTPFKALLVIFPLISGTGLLQAEILYKWTEADGTLTFSPTPPPASSGIAYQKVGGLKSVTADPAAQTTENTAKPVADPAQAQPSAADALPTPTLAPVIEPVSSIQPSRRVTPDQSVHMASVTLPPKKMTSRKSEQCNELVKRVTSLERLLSTRIDAETMDNAVVQMAKYQNSYNQACRGIQTSLQ